MFLFLRIPIAIRDHYFLTIRIKLRQKQKKKKHFKPLVQCLVTSNGSINLNISHKKNRGKKNSNFLSKKYPTNTPSARGSGVIQFRVIFPCIPSAVLSPGIVFSYLLLMSLFHIHFLHWHLINSLVYLFSVYV